MNLRIPVKNLDESNIVKDTVCSHLPKFNSKKWNSEHGDYEDRVTCQWKPPTDSELLSEQLIYYIDDLRDRNVQEDDALLVLYTHDYKTELAKAFLPGPVNPNRMLSLNQIELADCFGKIIVRHRRNSNYKKRDLNLIHRSYPQFTIGEVVDVYMRNKLKIKRRVAKYKRQIRKLNTLPSPKEYEQIVDRVRQYHDSIELGDDFSGKESDENSSDSGTMITETWSMDEIKTYLQGLTAQAPDFQLLSEAIGTKTEQMVRDYYQEMQIAV